MDERDLEKVADQVRRRFNVEVDIGKPHVQYVETIRHSVDHEEKFVGLGLGRRQYAHVVIRVEPLGTGTGLEFVVAPRDAIPSKYERAVEEGILNAAAGGVIAGYPLVDVKVSLLDGSYHEMDSSEAVFKATGATALKRAIKKAKPVVLEPVMAVEVVVPEEFSGPVFGDLNGRGGQVHSMNADGRAQIIAASVPLAEMFGYAADLSSMTEDRASHTMRFERYAEIESTLTREPEPAA